MFEKRYQRITEEKLAEFQNIMKRNEFSEGTIEKYGRDMKKCASWLGKRLPDQDNLVAFKEYLINGDYQPMTVNGILSSVNTYCKLMHIPVKLNLLKIQKRLFRDEEKELNEKEFKQLIATAEKQKKQRLKLIIETIGLTGIRVSELKYITVEAVERGMAEIRLKGKVRVILLSGKLRKRLRKYIKKEKIREGEVFVTRRGQGISRKQVWAEMKTLAKSAGIDSKKIFPHNLRHLFAKVFYTMTKNLVKLSNLLGHSSIDTTRIYLQTSVKDHLADIEKTGLKLLR